MAKTEENLYDIKRRKQREAVVKAAANLFIERGHKSVTMDEIASAAGVARRTLFNYYEGKEDILFDVAAPVLTDATRLALALSRHSAKSQAGVTLGDIAALCLSLWHQHGSSLEIIYTMGLEGSDRVAAFHAGFLDAFRKLMDKCDVGKSAPGELALAGRIIYRCFVPLLRALEGVENFDARFTDAFCCMVRSGIGLGV